MAYRETAPSGVGNAWAECSTTTTGMLHRGSAEFWDSTRSARQTIGSTTRGALLAVPHSRQPLRGGLPVRNLGSCIRGNRSEAVGNAFIARDLLPETECEFARVSPRPCHGWMRLGKIKTAGVDLAMSRCVAHGQHVIHGG